MVVPRAGASPPANHLSASVRLVLSSEFHTIYGCRISVQEHISKNDIEILHQRAMKNFDSGFKALLQRPPMEWTEYAEVHLKPLTAMSPEKGIYLDKCSLPSNSPFFDHVKIKDFVPSVSGFAPISINYMGSTTRSF